MASLAEMAVQAGKEKALAKKKALSDPDTIARHDGKVLVKTKASGEESLSSGNDKTTVKSKYRNPKAMWKELGLIADKLDPADPKNKEAIEKFEKYMSEAKAELGKYLGEE